MAYSGGTREQNSSVELKMVVVRPIRAEERSLWDSLMSVHHYLGFRHLTGKSLKYVAEFRGEWLALLGWGNAAFKSGARDRWIGWTPEQQWQRLHLVACNQRFLILPGRHIPNLASRVLSMNVRRLSQDWEEIHGHPILLAETFVDPSRFSGTCYRAAGWIALGQSRGFGRNAGRYFHHGQPKMIFVYPLLPDAQSLLSSSFLAPEFEGKAVAIVDLNKVSIQGKGGLLEVLSALPDPRKKRGIRHNQVSILATAVCACLSGMKSYIAISEWAKNLSQELLERLGARWDFNRAKYVAPSEPTLRRSLRSIDADEVDSLVGRWLAEQSQGNAVAVDGKTLRGSRKGDGKAVHLMSALLHEEAVVVGQQAVSDKSNEITAMKPLLEPLNLNGKVVTADALHAQVEHAHYLKEHKKADYLFIVKANQPGLLKDIQDLGDQDFSPVHQEVNKGHGRIEARRIQCSSALNGYINFPHAAQVFRLERSTTDLKGLNPKREMRYGVTSLPPEKATPADLLKLSRRHWMIENSLHWVRDVTFDEDHSQVRTGAGPRVMAILRNLAISLHRLIDGATNIAAALRHCNWNPSRALQMIGL